ncbi:THY1 Predicted alternative thymidylate synthase [uncultured Caudovirales phage]|uniref:THY1 Predicted alternative thymidylate synthase n=1 Tax=uncultured Caudovirales phage TaxID=2100421 RepID=A0A6J5L1L3_9CAUD|nr:THY1 Predicted alternative thymidylate synthase [uncultured Caudovirales phage]
MFDDLKVELTDSWGDDVNVAHQAWASTYDLDRLSKKTDEDVRRVVTDVVKHFHGTPKERLWFDFAMTMPIFLERQFDKYRMTVQYQDVEVDFLVAEMGRNNITQNELSGRYRTIPSRFYEMPDDVAAVVATAIWPLDQTFGDTKGACKQEHADMLQMQYDYYNEVLISLKKARDVSKTITAAEFKRAREVLRGVLGTAYMTDMRIICNLHSLEHILDQRLDPAAQLEGRVVACKMLKAVLDSGVAKVTMEQMVKTKDWQKYIDELSNV